MGGRVFRKGQGSLCCPALYLAQRALYRTAPFLFVLTLTSCVTLNSGVQVADLTFMKKRGILVVWT